MGAAYYRCRFCGKTDHAGAFFGAATSVQSAMRCPDPDCGHENPAFLYCAKEGPYLEKDREPQIEVMISLPRDALHQLDQLCEPHAMSRGKMIELLLLIAASKNVRITNGKHS